MLQILQSRASYSHLTHNPGSEPHSLGIRRQLLHGDRGGDLLSPAGEKQPGLAGGGGGEQAQAVTSALQGVRTWKMLVNIIIMMVAPLSR